MANEPSWDEMFAPKATETEVTDVAQADPRSIPDETSQSVTPETAAQSTPPSRRIRKLQEQRAAVERTRDALATEDAARRALVLETSVNPLGAASVSGESSPTQKDFLDEPSFAELLVTAPHQPSHGRRAPRRGLGCLAVLLATVLVLGGGATAVYLSFEQPIRSLLGWQEPIDFVGTGSGSVIVTIENGQVGADVARTLARFGVTKTYGAFYALLLKNPQVTFSPGSYALKRGMSAAEALRAFADPATKVSTQLVFPEGITVAGVIKKLALVSESTKVTGDQLTAAAKDFRTFGLPAEAPSLEGYLFPATYTFDPGTTAHAMLQRMVDEMFTRLDAAKVAPADRHRVLTLAALTQKEGGNSADFYKVSRVWQNRLAAGMNLQSDATVRYGAGGSKIATTDGERADVANKYNTYANPGLPVGPISNPGEEAIKATLTPAPGNWLFFVLIDGSTGETTFSATVAEHNAAVKVWQKWLRDHPGFDK